MAGKPSLRANESGDVRLLLHRSDGTEAQADIFAFCRVAAGSGTRHCADVLGTLVRGRRLEPVYGKRATSILWGGGIQFPGPACGSHKVTVRGRSCGPNASGSCVEGDGSSAECGERTSEGRH